MSVVPPPDHGPGWEYLYFAAELARGLAAHQSEYLEYQSQVTAPSGLAVADPAGHIRQLTDEIREAIAEVPRLLSPAVLEPAFGPPGQPGDEASIRSVAARLTEVYAELISCGLRVRNASVEPKWRPVYAALAKCVSLPLLQFQDFSAALSAKTAKVIADVRADIPQSEPLELALSVSVDPSAVSEFNAALAALKAGSSASPPTSPSMHAFPPQPNGYPRRNDDAPDPPFDPPAAVPVGSPLERARQLPPKVWFRRFGDIRGVRYETPAGFDPTKLKGHGLEPQRDSYDFNGEHREELMWPTKDGATSASPAHEWAFGSSPDDSVDTLVKGLAEGLELPGEPSDYHFMIQGTFDQLRKLGRRDLRALAELERLCWLDIALIEAWPRAVMNEYDDDHNFYYCAAWGHLIGLYETEGALYEAMEVAERAGAFAPAWTGNKTAEQELAQARDKRTELAERIAAIDAETAG